MTAIAKPYQFLRCSHCILSLYMIVVGLHSGVVNCTAMYKCLFFSIWPQYVKDRIRSTYMYFAGSIGLTALSAVAVSRSPALMGLMTKGSWLVSSYSIWCLWNDPTC